jgi:hypothetical protein
VDLRERPWGHLYWVEPYDGNFNTKKYLLSKEEKYHKRLYDTPRITEFLEANCQEYNINQRWVIARGGLEQEIWKWPNDEYDFEERLNEMLGFRLWEEKYLGWQNQISGCCKALRTEYLNPDNDYYVGHWMEKGVEMVHGSHTIVYPYNLGEALNMRYNPSESGLGSFASVYRRWFPEYAEFGMLTYDESISEWALDDVRWVKDEGIMNGYSDDNFGGKDPLTREQFASVIRRILSKEE